MKTLLATFIIMICFINTSFSQGVWMQKANFPGVPRIDAFYFSIENKGYTGGGHDTSGFPVNDFWEYDALNNSWTQKQNFAGAARWQAVSFSIGSKGYVGTGEGTSAYKDFLEYDPITDSWTQKANFFAERFTAVGFSIGNMGYLGTGNTMAGRSNDFWEYNPATDSWTQKSNVPGKRSYALGLSINENGYIGMGMDSTGYPTNDFYEYDVTLNQWTQKANFPPGPRYDIDGAHFTIENYGYAGTGYYNNDFWKYDPANDVWTQIPNLPASARIGAIGFSINNIGYIGLGQGSILLNDLWEFAPDKDTTVAPIYNQNIVYIPTIFSPNGDGVNDMLYIRGKNILELNFVIYNRWGEKVFETTDKTQGWDGTQNGNLLNAAVFVFFAKVIYKDGNTEEKEGSVTLIK